MLTNSYKDSHTTTPRPANALIPLSYWLIKLMPYHITTVHVLRISADITNLTL